MVVLGLSVGGWLDWGLMSSWVVHWGEVVEGHNGFGRPKLGLRETQRARFLTGRFKRCTLSCLTFCEGGGSMRDCGGRRWLWWLGVWGWRDVGHQALATDYRCYCCLLLLLLRPRADDEVTSYKYSTPYTC